MNKNYLLVNRITSFFSCFSFGLTVFLFMATPSYSQSNCYMLNQNGELLDLSNICGQKPVKQNVSAEETSEKESEEKDESEELETSENSEKESEEKGQSQESENSDNSEKSEEVQDDSSPEDKEDSPKEEENDSETKE
jgi:hypothetical protein